MNRNGKTAQRAGSRVAIVTPWFGPGLRGGAEQQSLQLAEHLAAGGHRVEVLTTCCPSFGDDWGRNVLRPGVERTGAFTIRRFRTDKRDRRDFERVNAILLSLDVGQLHRAVPPVGDDDAESFSRNNINSTSLYAYLANEGKAYERIVFIPYMFGPTLTGLPLVAERAYLQPCLHREAYAFLPRVAAAVHAAKGLLFNSEGEFELAAWLFGPGIIPKSSVVGEGVDVFAERDRFPERIGEFAPARARYVLYLGRQDPAKNIATLVAAYKRFRRRAPASTLRLVLAGERHVSYGESSAGIVDLGPVSESEKSALLASCRALAQPSVNESFSRTIYEAWSFGRPVVVHAECPPTATVVIRSGGGYVATSVDTWEDALHRIDSAPDAALDELGRRGAACAREITSWPAVIERYERAFASEPHATLPGNPERWDVMPDLPLVSALADGKANLLYVGPVVAVEHLEALLVVFLHYLTMDREARLTIAATTVDDTVYAALQAEVLRLDIVDRLLLARNLAPAQVQSLFLGADVFVSLNPGDDGAQELRSALWFDVPILARDTKANRAVAGGAAILLGDTSDLLAVGTLAQMLVTDRAMRDAILAAQRAVRLGSQEAQSAATVNIALTR